MIETRRNHRVFAGLVALAAVAVVLPWWRNHHFLRDFYDYGLVMAAAGRIAAGEHPYVDFVTPIQTGIFIFNGWFERMGDGTFQAMTRGAAVLTVLSLGVLAGMFRSRWPAWVAVGLGAALTGMTMAQHTIIWHNSLGAVCIAVAAVSAALAPGLRRSQWGWHLLTGLALVVGGITKLNAHLVAVGGVLAWALFAGSSRRAEWREVGLAAVFVFACGFVLPIGFELAWTRVAPAGWWYNVVSLPIGSRSGDLAAALHWKFYFSTHHGYYGPLPIPQLGALGCVVTAVAAIEGIRTLGWRQAGWVIGAALFAAAAGAGLLATNYDIAYIAMGAWFALVASLWLGFGLRCSGARFHAGLVAPVLVIGAVAWQSAWRGQRSQFGYSLAPRSDYVAGEAAAPDLGYMRGTNLPPVVASAMGAASLWRSNLPAEERGSVFYGPGLEWLERAWPATKIPGLPLWMHRGVSYGPQEEARLLQAIAGSGPYRHILVPEAWNNWGPVITPELFGSPGGRYTRHQVGGSWLRYDQLAPDIVSWRPLEFLRRFGGNAISTQLKSTMKPQMLADGRIFIGVTQGAGVMDLLGPSNRAEGEAVLRRLPGRSGPVAPVHFEVFSVVGSNAYPRWSADINLPEGEGERIVPFPVDCGRAPLRFVVTIPPALDGTVAAGWRALHVLDSIDGPGIPGPLLPEASDARLADETVRQALLPPGWNPEAVYVRDGHLGPRGLELAPGGEIWIRLSGLFTEITGVAAVEEGIRLPVDPVVRILYNKGPRLDIVLQSALRDGSRTFAFKAWSAERDGWLVVTVDPDKWAPPVAVRFTGAKAID